MRVIQLQYPFQPSTVDQAPKVMALGFFDGVHRGHQAVIKKAVQIGQQRHLPVAVMTFDRYPGIVFHKVSEQNFTYLSSFERKTELIAALGVDYLYVVNFTTVVGHLRPQAFVDQFLVGLGVKSAVAGFDYTYGRPVEIANMASLPHYAKGRFEVVTVARQTYQGQKISSGAIRRALATGHLSLANQLLGYVYETRGIVVHGFQRGRQLGFPTANVDDRDHERLPAQGVYVTKLSVLGKWYPAMTQIGRNLTFGNQQIITVEANILHFDHDIYDQPVKLRWYHYLRGEIKFAGASALIKQLQQDKLATETYFEQIADDSGC